MGSCWLQAQKKAPASALNQSQIIKDYQSEKRIKLYFPDKKVNMLQIPVKFSEIQDCISEWLKLTQQDSTKVFEVIYVDDEEEEISITNDQGLQASINSSNEKCWKYYVRQTINGTEASERQKEIQKQRELQEEQQRQEALERESEKERQKEQERQEEKQRQEALERKREEERQKERQEERQRAHERELERLRQLEIQRERDRQRELKRERRDSQMEIKHLEFSSFTPSDDWPGEIKDRKTLVGCGQAIIDTPLINGTHSMNIFIETEQNFQIGAMFNDFENYWEFWSGCGRKIKMTEGVRLKEDYTDEFMKCPIEIKEYKVCVKLQYSNDKGTLTFYQNTKSLGVAYTDLPTNLRFFVSCDPGGHATIVG